MSDLKNKKIIVFINKKVFKMAKSDFEDHETIFARKKHWFWNNNFGTV